MANKKSDYEVTIGGDESGLKQAADRAARVLGDFRNTAGKQFGELRSSIFDVRGAVTALVAGFSFKKVIDATIESEKQATLLNQTLNATGRTTEFTTEQLLEYAGALQDVSTYDDEAIASAERMMLTFKRVGKDVFKDSIQDSLDLAQALGIDLTQAAQIVGRALNDPAKAARALRAANIQLTQAQQQTIDKMVRMGNLAGAQRVILSELESRYKGAAAAAANTFGGALEQLGNTVGNLLEGDGPSLTDATQAIKDLNSELNSPGAKQGFATFVAGIITAVGWLAKFVTGTSNAAKGAGEFIAKMSGAVGDDDVDQRLEDIDKRIAKIKDSAEGGSSAWRSFMNSIGEDSASARDRVSSGATYSAKAEYDALIKERQMLEARKRVLADLQASPSEPSDSGTSGKADTAGLVDLKAELEAQQATLQAAGTLISDYIKRTQSQLDYSYQQNLISFKDYYAQRAELETKALNQQIAEQQAALAKLNEEIREAKNTGDDTDAKENQRKGLIAQITALERQRGDVAVKARRDQEKAEKDLSDQLAQVRERLQELQGQGADAQASALDRQYQDLRQRLISEGRTGDLSLVDQLIDVEKAKSNLDQIDQAYQRTLADMSRQEQSIQLEIDSGLISEREGRQKVLDLHQSTSAQLQSLIPQMQELAEKTGDPAAIDRLKDMDLQLKELGKSASELGQTLADAVGNGIQSAFDALSNGEGWRGALKGFLKGVGQSIQESLSKDTSDALSSFIKGLFNSASSGSGSAGSGFMAWLASIFHTGGIVGESGGQRRSVPPLAFAGAPRYHNGGIAGLKPDEVPAILQKGERVLTKEQQRTFGSVMAPVSVFIQTTDANSFRRSSGEIQAQMGQAVARALKRNR